MKSLRMIRRELIAVPLLLVGVALNQMRLTRSDSLSPWKGGGFGMFSSVDSPGERIVQCRAWDIDGREVRVDIGSTPAYEDAIERLRCAPNQRVMDWLAGTVLRAECVPVRLLREQIVADLQDTNPGVDLDLTLLTPSREILRPRTLDDGEVNPRKITRLGRVEVILRAPSWDSDAGIVSFEPLLTTQAVRPTDPAFVGPAVAMSMEGDK